MARWGSNTDKAEMILNRNLQKGCATLFFIKDSTGGIGAMHNSGQLNLEA